MKRIFLILTLCLLGCQTAQATTLSDGRSGVIAHCNGNTETECMGFIGQKCPYGFDVISKEHPNDQPNMWTMLIYCHDKFQK